MNRQRVYLTVSAYLGLVLSGLSSLLLKPVEDWALHHLPQVGIATGLALLGVLMITMWGGPGEIRLPPVPEEERLDRAMVRLAVAVERQWALELAHRKLATDDRLLAIRLTGAGTRGPGDGPRVLHSMDAVVAAFESIPSRRCVILGGPGSGKTSVAVLLTLGLARRRLRLRGPGSRHGGMEPVPVFVSLGGWNPDGTDPMTTGLMQWLRDRLAEEYPFLCDKDAHGPDAPGELLRTGRVLAILDGLDEIAALDASGEIDETRSRELRAESIRQIAEVCHFWGGLVLTCRAEEYRQAMGQTREGIYQADVLELEPIDLECAVAFVRARSTPAQLGRWEPVLEMLAAGRADELAEAFSAPLSVVLAVEAYSRSGGDPAELLDEPSAEAIEKRLLLALVDHAFPDRQGRWRGARAGRWLCFLARRMRERDQNQYDLRWWELPRLLGRTHRIAAGGAAFLIIAPPVGGGFAVVLTELGGPVVGRWAGVLAGAGFGAALGWMSARSVPSPTRIHFGTGGRRGRVLLSSAVVGLVGGACGWIILGSGLGAAAGAALAVPVAVAYAGATTDAAVRVADPRRLLHSDVTVALVFGLAYGVPTGFLVSFAVNPLAGLALGVGCALAGGLTYGLPWLITLRTDVGLVACAHLLLVRMLSRGRLPWRLIRFLEEAHMRGVLRKVGPTYQFRHKSLRDALADEPASSA